MKISLQAIVILVAALSGADLQSAEDVALYRDTVVQFASVEQARSVLSARDRFVDALSRFDVQSRLQTDSEVTGPQLARFAAQQALAWEPDEVEKLGAILQTIKKRLEAYELPFADAVLLIKTTGKEEGGAAYCRQNAIVLPQTFVDFRPTQLQSILVHELFHILSSGHPGWRHSLYELVGFRPCPSIELPESIKHRKITNPDAPGLDVYIELQVDGEQRLAVPLLYASVENYDPDQGGSFFRYLEFRLMVVRREADSWKPALSDGQPILLEPANVPSYHRQVGRNARTIIHPEEVLAENFSHMVRGTENLPTPELIERLRGRLQVRP